MNFRSKLALGFAAILALLLVAASYPSLRNVQHLSTRLRSSYADSVIPLRNAHVAHREFDDIRVQLIFAVLQRGAARDATLVHLEHQRREFAKAFVQYEQEATDEPNMQEVLAKYGVQEMNKRLQMALDGVKNNLPRLDAELGKVVALLRAGDQQAAENAYEQAIPLFNAIDNSTDTLEKLEVKQGEYLDKESQAVAQSAVRQIVVIALVAMVLGIFLVLVVARSVTEPLLRLTAAAQKVRAGDLDQVVKVEAHDEVGQLALAFNTMTESLRTARAESESRVEARTRELAAANELLNAQMAERERATQVLEQAKDAAEAANRAKSDFLAKMSHELRTPLNGVIGAVQLILNTDLGAEQSEYLQIARTSADGLLQVINDILDFSRAESGKLHFEDVDFNLRHTLEDALTTLSVRAAEKGLMLGCEVAPEVPEMLVGDPGRLSQVVLNLVGNAIKFTEDGHVRVAVEVQERSSRRASLHFAISDTGIGISPEHRPHIFGPFEQGDGSITRKYGGTGLGLAISAQLVDIMGGLIWVDSEVGEGSTFHFTARLGVSASPAPKLLPKRLSQFQGLRVLIADDDTGNLCALEQMLGHWGMSPVSASSGPVALATLETAASSAAGPFQLLLMDCRMPDALPLAEYATACGNLPSIAMVKSVADLSGSAVFCAKSASQIRCSACGDRARCREFRFAQYLVKPVRQSQVFDAIVNALNAATCGDTLPAASPQDAQEHATLRILIAEDNIINQKIAVRALQKWGYSVDVANNGKEAVAKLEQQPFDLILMDLQMPELDGFETTRAIREREKSSATRVPIIAVTAHAMQGDSERCFQASMDSYVSKPLQLQELFEEIQAVVAINKSGSRVPQDAGGDELAPNLKSLNLPAGELAGFSTEIMDAFVSDTPEQLKKLRVAAHNQDAATMKRLAHYLKGSAMYLGANRMTQLCKEVETLAAQDTSRVAEAAAVLDTEAARVCATLEFQLEGSNCG